MTRISMARDAILEAVNGVSGRQRVAPEHIAAEARALLDGPDRVRPTLSAPDVVESFVARITGPKVGASMDRIATLHELPAAVARYLARKGLELHVTLQPTGMLTAIDWQGAGLRVNNETDGANIVGLARWGIAETGSLVFHSAADMPILYNFLGDVHIVAVHAAAIVPYLEDYAATARRLGDPAPRNACLITGASGTTDIEGSLVKGAHGPRELHIVVVDTLPEGSSPR